MKKTTLLLLLFFVFNIFYITKSQAKSDFPTLPEEKTKTEKNYAEGEVLIKYKSDKKQKESLEKIKEKYSDIEVKDEIKDFKTVLLKSEEKSTEDLIDELKDDSSIDIIEPNYKRTKYYTPNDTYFGYQWFANNTGQTVNGTAGTTDADIDITDMWDIESSDATETIVAVIDDGVDYNEIDLSANMWDGSSCVDESGNIISGGCPNSGWNYEGETGNNDPYNNEHGNFIAHLIAAQVNNSNGIAGMSRYNKLKIMAVKFDFYLNTEIKAIAFAQENGAKVINASYGGETYSAIEKYYIDNFDGVFVAAAGNDYENNDAEPHYPCAYSSSNIICVASSNQNDGLSSFSNYGPTSVDIAAPGENIISSYLDSYYIGRGTSFAAPLVSGTAGLLYAQSPESSIETIKNTLLRSSETIDFSSKLACNRRLNTKNALENMQSATIPDEICSNVNASLFFEKENVKTVGQTFDVVAKINPGTNEVDEVNLEINFNPEKLTLNSVTKSDSFETILSGPEIDNTSGTASINLKVSADSQTCLTATSNIATFSFTATNEERDSIISFSSSSNALSGENEVVAVRDELEFDIILDTTEIYRLYNTLNGAYLYTRGINDRDYVLNKWPEFEFTDGIPAFYASLTEQSGLTPIYRLYNTINGMYLYTRGEIDRDYVLNKWPEFEFTDGEAAFYAYLTEQPGLTPIYRLYNTTNGAYLYTRGINDRDYVLNKWPEFEFTDGIPAFYADID